MSDPNLDTARRFDLLEAAFERLRKADAGLGSGTSFPASATTGLRFWRTDLGFLCYYDGTRWLTAHEQVVNYQMAALSAGSFIIAPITTAYAPYVTRCAVAILVSTTNNGTNFWTWALRGFNGTYAAFTTVHTGNTSAAAAGAWTIGDGAPNTSATPANHSGFDISMTATLAPGVPTFSASIAYRLIIT